MSTEENLQFQQGLASVKSRALAVFLDMAIFIAIFLPFNFYSTDKSEIIYLVFVYILLICIQVYFLAKSGQTIGKKILRIRIAPFNNPNETPSFLKSSFYELLLTI